MKRALIALLLVTPAYGQTYDPTLIQPVILGAPTAMTSLGLGDDNTRKVSLGFDFPYFDQTFSEAWVSSNGFISFQSPADLCCNGEPISQAPRNTIYGFWTDLISTTSPFISKGPDSFLVGWYGTKEYGTNNAETFEIALFGNGNIQFDYGSLALSRHNATAGMTGPTWDDNVQLFYGNNPSGLRNQSGLLSFVKPTIIEKVDCAVTPMDPSCPPATVSFAPSPAVQQPVAEVVTIADAYRADVAADVSDIAASAMSEPEQVIDTAVTVATVSVPEQVAVAQEATKGAAPAAERLSPEQVAALSAIQSMANDSNAQMAQTGIGVAAGPGSAAAFAVSAMQASQTASGTSAVDMATSSSSPSSQANTNEVLATSNGSAPAAGSSPPPQTDQAAGQQDDFSAMSASPGFAAYTQVSLQDRPDFYAIRDIYRNRRLRDANFEMYRMSQTNNALWKEMVDAQYGQ
jgi:hypothetical protein